LLPKEAEEMGEKDVGSQAKREGGKDGGQIKSQFSTYVDMEEKF